MPNRSAFQVILITSILNTCGAYVISKLALSTCNYFSFKSEMHKAPPCNFARRHQLHAMCETIGPSDRISSSLLGACIGDALAAPLHWYYNLQKMRTDIMEYFPANCKDQNGRLIAFCRPPSNLKHPDSWSYFSQYNPVDDPLGIVHGQQNEWTEPGTYYHAHLEPGEPTTTVQLALLLVRSLDTRAGYDYSDFLDRCSSKSIHRKCPYRRPQPLPATLCTTAPHSILPSPTPLLCELRLGPSWEG